jgi:general secretion pathway protein C
MMKIWFDRRRLIGVVVLFLASFVIAHSVNAVIAYHIAVIPDLQDPAHAIAPSGGPPSPSSEELSQHILHSGLFPLPRQNNHLSIGADGGEAADAAPPLNLSKKLVLRGTSYGDLRFSTAIIEEIASKSLSLYHLTDDIPNAGELVEIRREGVLIRQGRREEFLPINAGDLGEALPMPVSNVIPDPKKKMLLDRREVNAALSDLSKLLGQARANPYFVDGKVNGFLLTIFNPDSFFGRIGLISGDVLKRVNGIEVRDPGQVVGLFQQVKEERLVKVDVLRQGLPATLTYEIR